MMKYFSDLNWWKQLGLNIGGVLTSILAFLGVLNIHYEWFTEGSINAFVTIILAIGTLFVGSFATVINTYLTHHSKHKAQKVAKNYEAELQALEAAENKKIDAIAQKVAAIMENPTSTPSTDGDVNSTDTASK